VLGESHPDTATSHNNLAACLDRQGKHADALPLHQKALAIRLKVLGEQHPDTATSHNNLAACLDGQGKYVEALPLFQKALNICQRVLGEQHPYTATCYNNLAACLSSQGRHADALPLLQRALAICRKVLEQHPDTGRSCNSAATCLHRQGRHAEALPLFEKALAICGKALGEQHPHTATCYNSLAICLVDQGKHADALPLLQKGLAIRLRTLGEQHPGTALGYRNLAFCLNSQGKHAEALPLYQKALALCQKVLGEQHPDTATCYHSAAFCLDLQGRHAEALPLLQKALAIRLKVLGEQHPDTANAYNNLAVCLFDQGKHAAAVPYWEKALLGSEWGRLQASVTGFDRSLYKLDHLPPHSALAACLVRQGKPLEAWQHDEADLARGLLDDLPSTEAGTEAGRRTRLRQLDQALLRLSGQESLNAEQVKRRDALVKERDGLLSALATAAARRLRERLRSLPRIQKQLPADAALVFWLDVRDEHLGCVLRPQGPPTWVPLPGSDKNKKNAWTRDDWSLPERVLSALADSGHDAADRQRLLAQLQRQRIAALEPHLKGVRQLLVVPSGRMSAVPVEALTQRYTVSYVPSASVFARRAEQSRPLQATSLLVLADPTFRRAAPEMPPAPAHGLLVLALTPGSLAARIGLRPGDVLLEYNGKKLSAPADLTPAEGTERVPLKLWREGKGLAGRVPAGNLGVVIDKRPLAEALAAWRKQEGDLLALGRGQDWLPLPGTRLEARALAALVPRTTTLLGSEASQQKLAELAAADKLKDFRLLHLATHGQASDARPDLTALILAQDHLDDPATAARAVLAGKRPVDGRLTVGTILSDWRLDADLVVLSACQTGLGTESFKEGMLGFTQALLQKAARSVVLSRWKVDDAATALLMARFYENLLGARQGTKRMGRADALAEAKSWLRRLSRADATKHLAALVGGVPRGERGSIKAALPTRRPDAPKGEDRPFAAPYYWAAFVLIGDPN
jgi:CHAT domain-containing protein/Tfp pilus assembly protein PilF